MPPPSHHHAPIRLWSKANSASLISYTLQFPRSTKLPGSWPQYSSEARPLGLTITAFASVSAYPELPVCTIVVVSKSITNTRLRPTKNGCPVSNHAAIAYRFSYIVSHEKRHLMIREKKYRQRKTPVPGYLHQYWGFTDHSGFCIPSGYPPLFFF